MNTLPLAPIRPLVVSKLFWIRLNRLLAWVLLVSPLLQWAAHTRFVTGLAVDGVLLLAHGLLSLILFGKPETRERGFSVAMHLMGFRPRDLSERNRFLLSGYRIALALAALALLFTPFKWFAFCACMMCLYPLLRLSVTVIQHVFGGVRYALRRWGERNYADGMATAVVIVYLYFSFANLARG